MLRQLYRTGLCNGRQAFSTVSAPAKAFQIGGVKADGSTNRFYAKVSVVPLGAVEDKGDFAVNIDDRFVQTPRKKILTLPNRALALAVAGEWALQTNSIRPTSMPLTALATSAIDQFSDAVERTKCLGKMKAHLRADAICFRVDSPEVLELVAKQSAAWDPLIDWVRDEFNAPLKTTTELYVEQPERSIEILHNVISNIDPWRLSALDAVASLARSYVIGLAVARRRIMASEAFDAARVDEEHQIDNWGKVEGGHDIDQAFATLRMSAVGTFLQLLDAPK